MKLFIGILVAFFISLSPAFAQSRVQLHWSPSAVSVDHYNIYRDGTKIGESSKPSYVDSGLTAATTYHYTITAVTSAGKESNHTASITITTKSTIASGFPNVTNTGVPAGTILTNYTGPCTITTNDTVIDSKIVNNCSGLLLIRATGVIIKNSKIYGEIQTEENTSYSFTITDTEVDALGAETGVGGVNFTATRVHVYNARRSMYCWNNVTIQDSYVHSNYTDSTGAAHQSGMRMSSNCTFKHNTITCDAPDVPPDGGCSAGLTGYGDFGPVENNIIDNNYFMNTNTGGYCAYGGSSAGKPYSADANNIQFTNNIWQRKPDGTKMCGNWGPITDFNASAPGNVWTNNKWDDGTAITP